MIIQYNTSEKRHKIGLLNGKNQPPSILLIFLTLYAKTIPFFSYTVYPLPLFVLFSLVYSKNMNIIRFFPIKDAYDQFFIDFPSASAGVF